MRLPNNSVLVWGVPREENLFPVQAGALAILGLATGQSPISFALTPFVPLLWAWCPSWRHAWAGMACYYAVTSWTLVPSYVEYLELGVVSMAAAMLIWLLAAALSASVWGVLYRADKRWTFVRLLIIAVLTTLPPLGLFQWMSPFLGLAFLSPLYGWVGIVVGIWMLAYIVHHPSSIWLVLAMPLLFTLWTPRNGEGLQHWGAINTTLDTRLDTEGYAKNFAALRDAGQQAATRKLSVAVLGESVGGHDLDGARLALGRSERTTFLVGGSQVVPSGTQAQLWIFRRGEKGGEIAYRQRIPAPFVSGLLPAFGQPVTIEVDGKKIAPVICYEGLTAWGVTSALLARPDALLLVTNTAWSSIEPFAHAQLVSHLTAWGKLFGLPTIVASNRSGNFYHD